ncbi:class I SAM-dependent methyltransferase [Arthrobacter globiformis]|uniref:class I SAM-dependent methyltransferase n=1 Tax=Arthrobacter globiformis TaxID=1665 RepID=UPI00279115BC|nr:class I SAM-dependent methyltransferase [Arthrobacter globiformis]MDQ0618858.1 ubiquinone/menaquinone biosynthesis C-methylase UbiE [Arthrobacter globiformis]
MTDMQVQDAYAARAAKYTALFGSAEKAHGSDQRLMSHWAQSLSGPAIDAGCGPGHWTAFLANHGIEVEGIDLVPLFIEEARRRFAAPQFRVATLRALGVPDGHLAGILAWYSLIHFEPAELPVVLSEFARCISPGGSILLGFFEGSAGEPFPHAVATAYYWSVDAMSQHLVTAGFEVQEVHVRAEPENRPHAAIIAVRTTPQGWHACEI